MLTWTVDHSIGRVPSIPPLWNVTEAEDQGPSSRSIGRGARCFAVSTLTDRLMEKVYEVTFALRPASLNAFLRQPTLLQKRGILQLRRINSLKLHVQLQRSNNNSRTSHTRYPSLGCRARRRVRSIRRRDAHCSRSVGSNIQ